uniref:PPIase cyclophilin-type domain-containing protein n=1 Tax=Pelagomonas calceolata TaxID=35677 RepID=A0A7S3ZRX2_9STRA
MSSVYHTEPPTKGKVVFQTSVGPIDVELWSKEAPKACRNFIQLALEGYYDRTTFHRVIPGFMAQGGDPTGTGEGGDSVWGKYFRDEVNARIRFNHRGQLAMANENRPDTNRAQFFFTLDACEWLNGKHTIFGTVAGDTVFNLLRMGEVETDDNDRPVDGITLKTVEVLLNPFDDVVPRISQNVPAEVVEVKPKPRGTKNLTLLSFGEEEASEAPQQRMKPAPARKEEKPLRPMLEQAESSSDEEDEEDRLRGAVKSAVARGGTGNARAFEKKGPTGAAGFAAKMAQKLKERRAAVAKREAVDKRKAVCIGVLSHRAPSPRRHRCDSIYTQEKRKRDNADNEYGFEQEEDDVDEGVQQQALEAKREEARQARRALARSLRPTVSAPSSRPAQAALASDDKRREAVAAARQLLSPSETLRQQHRAKSGRTRSREADTLAKLSAFSSSLKATKEEVGEPSVEPVTYSGQVLDADSESDDEAWFAGKLKFRKHTDDLFRTGTVDDYATYDPHGKFGSTAVPRPRSYGGQAPPPNRGGDRRGDGRSGGDWRR